MAPFQGDGEPRCLQQVCGPELYQQSRFLHAWTSNVVARFFGAVEGWMNSQVEQARNRSTDEIPSVESFIVLRRQTIGGPIVEGL